MNKPPEGAAEALAPAPQPFESRTRVNRNQPGMTRRQALGMLGAIALPWDAVAQPSATPPSTTPAALPPDLVNLHSTIEWIAGERSLHLSFLDARWRELETWKQTARPFFRELLRHQPKALPLKAD